jgi:hypothetical protein
MSSPEFNDLQNLRLHNEKNVFDAISARKRHSLFRDASNSLDSVDPAQARNCQAESPTFDACLTDGSKTPQGPVAEKTSYKDLGYVVPKGREEMVHKTVGDYLKERGYSSTIPADRQWMIGRRLGDFGEFWHESSEKFDSTLRDFLGLRENKPLEFSSYQVNCDNRRTIPEAIDGKKVVWVPGTNNNCPFYAIMQDSRVQHKLEEMAKAKKLSKDVLKEIVVCGARAAAGGGSEMLDFNGKELGKGVQHLRNIGLLERDCNIRVYYREHLSGDIVSFNATLGNTDINNRPNYTNTPYGVFYANNHYWAVPETKDSSHVQQDALRIPTLDSADKRKLTELLFMDPSTATESDGLPTADLIEIVTAKGMLLQEMRVPLDEIYQDLRGQYPDIMQSEKFKIGDDEHSREFLSDCNYRFTKARLLDLTSKLAPADYEDACVNVLEHLLTGAGLKYAQNILSFVEENKDTYSALLCENQDKIKTFADQSRKSAQNSQNKQFVAPNPLLAQGILTNLAIEVQA